MGGTSGQEEELKESASEQRELPEVSPEEPGQTLQERVITLYDSPKLHELAIGFWMKFFIEALIVTVPLIVVLLIPSWVLAWLGIGPVTYLGGLTLWATFSWSVLLASWCFSKPAVEQERDTPGQD